MEAVRKRATRRGGRHGRPALSELLRVSLGRLVNDKREVRGFERGATQRTHEGAAVEDHVHRLGVGPLFVKATILPSNSVLGGNRSHARAMSGNCLVKRFSRLGQSVTPVESFPARHRYPSNLTS